MIKETLTLLQGPTYSIQATYYYKTATPPSLNLLYLHGGGYVLGNRDDLPETYRTLLLDQGYGLVTLDYLLAPESKLDEILDTLELTIKTLLNQSQSFLGRRHPAFYLFGRSAGSYLALQMTQRIKSPAIKGLILFYGYHTLNEPSFLNKSPHYAHYPRVGDQIISSLLSDQPLTQDNHPNRYLLYLSGRQTGRWIHTILGSNPDLEAFSLTLDDLKELPPTLLVHSRQDPDVPYFLSQVMAQTIPHNQLITIEGNQHDFDRTDLTKGVEVYSQVIDWIHTQENDQ